MGITYKDFMKYKNDSKLYSSLNEKNKKIFWEYGETNQLIPFDLPKSALDEKNKYVRPGYINPRYKESGPNPAYEMTQGQEKTAMEAMRKQSGDYLKQQQTPSNIAKRNELNAIATKIEQDEKRKKVASSVAFKQPSTAKVNQPSVMPITLGKTPLKSPSAIAKDIQGDKPSKRIQEVLMGVGPKPTPDERKQANDYAAKTKQGAFASSFWKGVPFGGSAPMYKENKEAIAEGQAKFPKASKVGATTGGLTGQGLTYALASPVIGATKVGQALLGIGKGALGGFVGKQALELGIDVAIQTPQEVVKAINEGSTFGDFAKSWGENMALSVLFNGVIGGGAEGVKALKNTLSSADALKALYNSGIDEKAVTDAFKALENGNPKPLQQISDTIYVNPQGTASKSLAQAEMPLSMPDTKLALPAPSQPKVVQPQAPTQPTVQPRGVKPIQERSFEEVGSRSVKAYQFENPEVKPFYKEQAQELLGDIKDTQGGRRTFVEDEAGYTFGGEKRITSDLIADIKDSTKASYAEIRTAIEKIIKDNGLENNALSKRIEMIIDDSLVKGYTDFNGMKIPPNAEYINIKNALDGVQPKQFVNPEFDAWAKNLTGKQDFTPQEIDGLKRVYENQTGKSVDAVKPFDFSAKVSKEVPRTITPNELAEQRLLDLGRRVKSGEVSQAEAEMVAKQLTDELQAPKPVEAPVTKPIEQPIPKPIEQPVIKPIEQPTVKTEQQVSQSNTADIKTPEVGASPGKAYDTIGRSDVIGDNLSAKLKTVDDLPTTTNEARQEIASKAIKNDFEGSVAMLKSGDQFSSRIEPFMAKDAVTKLQEVGRYDDAFDIIEAITRKGRASGQDVQSFTTWNMLTPEGMGKWAVKTMEKAGLKADGEVVKSVMSKVKQLQRATAEDMAKEIASKSKLGFNLQFFSKNLLTESNLKAIKNSAKTVKDIEKILTERITKTGISMPKDAIIEMATKLKNAQGLSKDELTNIVEATLKDSGANTSAINRVMGRYNFEEMKALNTALIMKEVTDKLPISFGRKLSTYQAISHLLNGRTFMRNIAGNTASIGAEMLSRIPSSMADRALSVFTGNRSIIAAMPKFKQAINEGIKQGSKSVDEILLGVNRVSNDKYDLFFGNTFKSKPGRTAEKALSLSLVAPDEVFKGIVKADSLYNQVQARLGKHVKDWDFKKILDNATTEEIKIAGNEARFATFQNDSFLADVFSNFKTTLNRIPVIPYKGMKKLGQSQDFGLGDLVFKYTKVPGNIITRGFEYSPMGYIKFMNGLGKVMHAKGKITPELQRQISMQFGRATTGTGLLALGTLLYNTGVISGADKGEDLDLTALNKAEGLGNYKLNISALNRMSTGGNPEKQSDDTIISYDWLQPLGVPIAVGAKMAALSKDKKFGMSDVASLGQSTFEEAMDIPSLFTLKSMFYEGQGDGGPFDVMSVPFKDAIPGMIPSPVRQISQKLDPTVRQADTVLEKIQANTPFSKGLLPKVDPTGKEITRDQNLFDALVNPSTKTKYKPIVYADELRNIAKMSGKDSVFPDRKAPSTVTNKKVKFTLTPKEKVTWMKTEGALVDKAYTKYLKHKDADTTKKAIALAKALEKLKDKASEKAKAEFIKNRK